MKKTADSVAGYSEMKRRLAHLKQIEVVLLREAAEIKKALVEKEGEIQMARRQIAQLTQQIHPNGGAADAASARPKPDTENSSTEAGHVSLPTLIERLLRESKDGLSLSDLTQKLLEGYTGQSKTPRSLVDQAIFRLKKRGRITRNRENLRFFLTVLTEREV